MDTSLGQLLDSLSEGHEFKFQPCQVSIGGKALFPYISPFSSLSAGSLILLSRYGPAEHDPPSNRNTTLITGAENAEQRCRNPLSLIQSPIMFFKANFISKFDFMMLKLYCIGLLCSGLFLKLKMKLLICLQARAYVESLPVQKKKVFRDIFPSMEPNGLSLLLQ